MARFVELSLNRLFRSRWGIGFVILVLILAIVGVGRVFSDGNDTSSPAVNTGSPAPAISADPDDDDSVISPEPPPSPTTDPGMAQPEAVAYAFASAWVDHKNVSAKTWHDGVMPNSTKSLSDELNNVDPADVPAGCAYAARCPLADAHCRAEDPPLVEDGAGRRVACWHAGEELPDPVVVRLADELVEAP